MAGIAPVFAPGALTVEQQQLLRQQRMADMLQQQSQEAPQGQMVSGRYVAPSMTQHLARLANALAARSMYDENDQKQRDILTQQRESGIQDMNSVMEALNGQESKPGIAAPADELGGGPGLPATAAVPGSKQEAMARALRSENPMVQGIGAKLLEQSMKGQEGININGQLVDKYTGLPMGNRIKKEKEDFTLSPGQIRLGADGKPIAQVLDFNKAFNPDGTPNTAFQSYEISKSRAGAPSTQVSVNTATKPFLSAIGQGAGEAVNNAFAGAQAAVGTLNNVQQIKQGLKNVIVGPGAGVRVKLAQIGEVLGVNGKDDTEKLQNTRTVIQGLARQELAAAAQMKGQGQITESERGILKRAESGDITDLSKAELTTLVGALEKTANYRINLHNENLKRLEQDPNASGVVDFMRVTPPTTAPEIPTPAAAPSNNIDALLKKYGG